MAGSGPEEGPLRKLSSELGLDETVTFLGHVPHARLDEIWRRSHVVVVPSLWPEPFGLVAVEAIASGRPVIASGVGGLEEIVVEGRTGCLVAPGDVGGLASRMIEVLGDLAQAQRKFRGGAAWIVRTMDNASILAEHLKTYRHLVDHEVGG